MFLSKKSPCAWNISWRKNMRKSDITSLRCSLAYPYQKDMPIPIDIYDADAKKHNSVINNEQQHEVKA
jgi:hypothetical protein